MSDALASTQEGLPSPDTGNPPELRFRNTSNMEDGEPLYARFGNLKRSGGLLDWEKDQIEGMQANWPPYTTQQLEQMNAQFLPNSSRGEMPRRIGQKVALWMDFAAGNSGLWRVTFNNAPPDRKEDLEDMASECLNTAWTNFPKHTNLMIKAFKEQAKYGFGPVVWSDCWDPSPHAKMAWEMRFPPSTEIDMSNLPECGMNDEITLMDLYEASKRDERLKKMEPKEGATGGKILGGWNSSLIVKLMKQSATAASQRFDYTSMSDMMAAESIGQLWTGNSEAFNGSSIVPVVRMWIREYDEVDGASISYYTLADISGWKIIQARPHHYRDWTATLAAAMDDTGLDGTISGLKGLGMDIRAKCRDMDIMDVQSTWAAMHQMTPHYAAPNDSAAQAMERSTIRPFGIFVANGVTEFQSQVDYSAGIESLRRMSQDLDTIQGVYQLNTPNHKGTQRTAEESRNDALKEQDSRLAQVLPMSKMFIVPLGREFARRLMEFPRSEGEILKAPGWEVARYFWAKVSSFPELELILPSIKGGAEISVNPNATPDGLDKKLMKHLMLLERLPLYNTQPQRNRIINGFTAAVMGHTAAIPLFNEDEQPMDTNLDAFIDSENADMIAGSPRIVFPDQDHYRHLGPPDGSGGGHCGAIVREMVEISDGLQEQFQVDAAQDTADRLYSGLAFLAHCDAHIMLASQNPALMDGEEIQFYYNFSAELKNLLKTTLTLFQKEMQKRATEDGTQVDPKVQAIMAKTEAEITAMLMKTDADIKANETKMITKLGQQQQVAEARTRQKQVDYTLSTAMKQQQLKIDLAIKSIDAGTRAVQERADAERDLAKAEKERAAAAKPAGGAS